jgi:hypothetical protein
MEQGFVNMPTVMRGNTALKLPETQEAYGGVELIAIRGGAVEPAAVYGKRLVRSGISADRDMFELYYNNWRAETKFLSSSSKITRNPNFQAIVQMGTRATPFIAEIIRQEPSLLVWALAAIYKKRISDAPISIQEAGRLWLKALNY